MKSLKIYVIIRKFANLSSTSPKFRCLDIDVKKFEISAIICKSHEAHLLFEDCCEIFILQWCGL